MLLDNELNAFIERLNNSTALNDVKIVKAYPYAEKPTWLEKTIIAVSPAIIEAEGFSVGQEDMFASYTIDADIFVPFEKGSPEMWAYIQAVLSSQVSSMPSAVSVSRIKADNRLHCFTAKCALTYNGALNI